MLGLAAICPVEGAVKPNILIIVADDLGYADLGVQGSRDLRTPHLDSLAANGVRMTDGYVTNPLCAPSRAALMTGRYQQRFGFEYNPGNESEAPANFGVPLSEKMLSERLKEAGYTNLAVGKWHLGYRPEVQPRQRGFDGFYGHLSGHHGYLQNDDGLLTDDGTPLKEVTYTTDMFGERARDFMRDHSSSPWFVYLAFSAVHGKIQATQKYLDRFTSIPDRKRHILAAMMSAVDDNIGGLLSTLKETGQYDRTFIVFLSDNGGMPRVNASLNTPLSGQKGDLLEGGIRVPILMQWPDGLPRGLVYRQPVSAVDIAPTVLAAAGLPTDDKFDGVDLLPFLTGRDQAPPHEALYWRVQGAAGWAVRQGDWKLLFNAKTKRPVEALYNLRADPGETHDLAAAEPAKVAELRRAWEQWNERNIEPLWDGKRAGTKKQSMEDSE